MKVIYNTETGEISSFVKVGNINLPEDHSETQYDGGIPAVPSEYIVSNGEVVRKPQADLDNELMIRQAAGILTQAKELSGINGAIFADIPNLPFTDSNRAEWMGYCDKLAKIILNEGYTDSSRTVVAEIPEEPIKDLTGEPVEDLEVMVEQTTQMLMAENANLREMIAETNDENETLLNTVAGLAARLEAVETSERLRQRRDRLGE